MGHKTHGVNGPAVIVDGSNETKIVGDVKNGDGTLAFHLNLVCVAKGLAALRKTIPKGRKSDSVPMVKRSASFGVGAFSFIEEVSGDDTHERRAESGQIGHNVKVDRHCPNCGYKVTDGQKRVAMLGKIC